MRWVIVLFLVVASATASAQTPAVTQRAQETAVAIERTVGTLAARRGALAARYETELRAIDRLKTQRASWKRDRELRDQLSKSLETANQLAAVTRELQQAHVQLAAARRTLVAAIDAELKTAAGARAAQLQKQRAQYAPPAQKARRIVIPDTEIDPYADPEELERQAAALRESEAQLQRQIVGLEAQSKELERVAKLRKQHERAGDLARRDDDQPRRGTPAGGRGGVASEDASAPPSPTNGAGSGGAPPQGDSRDPAPSSVESDAPVVLQDVVDPGTIDSLQKAQRSGDPAQRAAAAKRARDAVEARLAQVRAKRAAIEARAKQLRGR